MTGIRAEGFLADSVVAAEGKLYVQGAGWNRIVVGAFPARHDRIGIALLLRAEPTARGSHRFELRVLGPDGRELPFGGSGGAEIRPSGEVTIRGGPAHDAEETVIPLAINLDGMVFEHPGPYRFVLSVDGEDRLTLRFGVQLRAGETPPVSGGGGYL